LELFEQVTGVRFLDTVKVRVGTLIIAIYCQPFTRAIYFSICMYYCDHRVWKQM